MARDVGKSIESLSLPIEEPEKPEVVVDTSEESIEQSAEKVLEYLRANHLIS